MKNFNVGIKSVIVKDRKILLLKRTHESKYWDIPGGRINDNETIEQALKRELKEEVTNARTIEIDRILSAFRIHKDIQPGISLVLIFYRVNADFGDKPQLSDEHVDWILAGEKKALKIADPAAKEAIKQALKY